MSTIQSRPESAERVPGAAPSESPTGADLLDHEYDGIREFDNPTPGWWHAIFIGSIVFSVFYFLFWEFSPMAWTHQDVVAQEQSAETKRVFGAMGDLANDEATLQKLMADQRMMAVARGTFLSNCAACHATDGGGVNGANLTDDHYKNVTRITDIAHVIEAGAANGAMPAWANRLQPNERVLMAAYVASLRGTTPKAPRGPEGQVIPAWTAK